jgi:hypothetical protein
LNGLTHAVRQTLRPSDSWLNCCIRLIAADTGSFRSRFSLPLFKTTGYRPLLLLFLALFALGSIISGTEYLVLPLPGGVPLGNLLAAAVFICLAGAAFLLAAGHRRLRQLCAGNLLAAWLWLPVSIALAGNVALNFSGQTGTLWLGISALLFCAILGSFLLVAGRAIHSRSEPRSRLK